MHPLLATSLFAQEIVNGVVQGGVYVLVAIGLSLVFGVLKVVNFAHGEFYVVGGFVAYLCTASLGLPYWSAVVLAALAGLAVGAVAERLAVKPLRGAPEDAVFLSTFGLSLVLLYGVKLLLGGQPHTVATSFTGDMHFAGVVLTDQQLVLIALTIVLVGALFVVLRRSYVGLVLRAVAQDRATGSLMGIEVERVYWAAFAVAAALAAVAGAIVAPLYSVNPYSGQDILITAFIVVIAAGLGSLPGAVMVGLGLGIAEALAAGYGPSGSRQYVAYVLVVAVLLFRPQGLFPGTARAVRA
ncbi:MAG TPA: branched-chain amino acid ABC transporter permease [Conexibacter sp.]|jgi:branched-chain amino acid transport system permease protein